MGYDIWDMIYELRYFKYGICKVQNMWGIKVYGMYKDLLYTVFMLFGVGWVLIRIYGIEDLWYLVYTKFVNEGSRLQKIK